MGWEKISNVFANSVEAANKTSETAQQTGIVSFSLIISIIAMSIVVLLCFATFYFGGDAFKTEKKKRSKLDFSPR